MIRSLVILLTLLFPKMLSNKAFMYYDSGKPTPKGIERYIWINEHQFAKEYMTFVQDTLYDYYMHVDDLSYYTEYNMYELGRYYFPSEIIITNEIKFIDYAVDSLSRLERSYIQSNGFVKGCVFHELTHIWLQQITREMLHYNQDISPEFRNFRIYNTRDRDYGAVFLEEGICDYVSHKAGEIINPKTVVPDFNNDWNGYEIKYQYAEYYVRSILDGYDNIKEGIKRILLTPPPTKEEIRKPELYYQRVLFPEGM